MNHNGLDQRYTSASDTARSANVKLDTPSPSLPEPCSPPKKATLRFMVNLIDNTKYLDRSLPSQGVTSKQRSEVFQRLVRQYIVQIRYGCTSQSCTTPTCFSCHKRVSKFPVRRPSVLTARCLAFQLATEDDPYSALCPQTPLASPQDFLRISNSDGEKEHVCKGLLDTNALAANEKKDRRTTQHASEIMPIDPMDEVKAVPEADQAAEQSESQQELPVIKGPVLDYQEIHRSLGYKKDKKSLTQSVFDTRSVKLYEWQTVISPMDILKTPSMRGTAAKKQKSDRNRVSQCNEDSINSVEKIDQEPMDCERKRSTSPCTTEPTKMNEKAVPASCSPTSDKNHAPVEACIPQTADTKPLQDADWRDCEYFAIVEPLSAETICGLRSLALQAKGLVEFGHTGNYWEGSLPPSLLSAAARPILLDFVKRTLVYNFSNPHYLLRLIQHNKTLNANSEKSSPTAQSSSSEQNFGLTVGCFTCWVPIVGSLLLDSIWQSLEGLFMPPPKIASKFGHDKAPHYSNTKEASYIHDTEAADIIHIAILVLVGSGYSLHDKSQGMISDLRAWGRTLPNAHQSGRPDPLSEPWLDISDYFEYEPAVRLAKRLVRAIAARRSFWLISQTMSVPGPGPKYSVFPVMRSVVLNLKNEMILEQHTIRQEVKGSGVPFYFMEWMRTIILKTWNGEVTVKRWEGTGAAIEILSDLYHSRHVLGLPEEKFQTPFLSNHLMDSKIPEYFALPRYDKNFLNILDYSFLLVSQIRVSYFRALNFASMSDAYQSATFTDHLKNVMMKHSGREDFSRNIGRWDRNAFLDSNLKAALQKYLVLDVRRDHLLEDAFNQLWGREKRELLRPLKVRMGMGEGGEEGVDHGGVSQEFFRLVFEKAFEPEAGLFVTTDPQANMTWFQPLSLEPLQTYELIGLLMGLAVYNGITIPMSFPQAFYRKLLGMQARYIIDDGWPTLKKSLQEMQEWKDGDVADVFVREFAFSCTANGQNYTAHVYCPQTKPDFPRCAFVPANEATDIPLVTNKTRVQYRMVYMHWLLDLSIGPQYEAFSKGFFTIITEQSLQLLSPALLKNLAEGYQIFDIKGLYKFARYEDGYSRDSQVIKWFWTIVFEFDEVQKKRLLEFVTASDRIPVQGWGGLSFSIVRNGGDTERIPTSMTCFGKLLLPEYASIDKLRRKLELALENSKGFGSA